MITIRTTLILGAGASNAYGFPLGSDLRRDIINRQGDAVNSEESKLWEAMGFSNESRSVFARALDRTGIESIDALLETQSDLREIGKVFIALEIGQHEKDELFWDLTGQALHGRGMEHWYRFLWNKIRTRLDEFGQNQLKVVTFNYDRSLEYYLFHVMQNSLRLRDDVVAQAIARIPIIHVYGQLGQPHFWGKADSSRNYSPPYDKKSLENAIEGIKVIDERADDSNEFQEARKAIQWADRVCFLGFGFDRDNLRRLRMHEFKGQIYGTSLNVGSAWVTETQARLICENINDMDALMNASYDSRKRMPILKPFTVYEALNEFPVLTEAAVPN